MSSSSESPAAKNEKEDEEEPIDEEESDGEVEKFEVHAVKNMRYQNKKVEFFVVWESDGTSTWEPIQSFPGELEHAEIQRFKEKNPDKWENVMNQGQEKRKKSPKKSKHWSYVPPIEEDRFEKQDDTAAREAKSLADPNRLEDPEEKFLKTYGIGIEGRLSRSKTKEIKRNIAMSSADSSPSIRQPSPPKKREKKNSVRKRKQKDEEASTPKPKSSRPKSESSTPKSKSSTPKPESSAPKPESSSTTSSNLDTSAVSEKSITDTVDDKKIEEKKVEEAKTETMSKLADGIETWVRKKRDYKLNSSDSSEEEPEEVPKPTKKRSLDKEKESASSSSHSSRIEGGANSRPLSPVPTTDAKSASSAETILKKKKKESAASTNQDTQKLNTERKRPKKRDLCVGDKDEHRKTTANNRKVRHAKDPGNDHEQDLAEYGIKYSREHTQIGMKKELAKRKARHPQTELTYAIMRLDIVATELCLIELGSKRAFGELTKQTALHDVLTNVYDEKSRNVTSVDEIREREKIIDKLFRMALPYLPLEILRLQDSHLNTLLHCAINSQIVSVVELLINMGSPFHIRNQYEMTAVESCLVMKNAPLLEIVIKNGGTFHHILNSTKLKGEDHASLKNHLSTMDAADKIPLMNSAKRMNDMIESACQEVRTPLLASRIHELDKGPIVCFPRGNLRYEGHRQTIQFFIPEDWVNSKPACKFMLVAIPMAYHHQQRKFYGSPRTPRMKLALCGTVCKSMTKDRSLFYRATKSLRQHFFNVKRANIDSQPRFPKINTFRRLEDRDEMVRNRITQPQNPRICTISLEIDHTAVFSFIACQLIRYKTNKLQYRFNGTPKNVYRPHRPNVSHTRPYQRYPNTSGPSSNDPRAHHRPANPR